MKKRIIALFIAAVLVLSVLAGCSTGSSSKYSYDLTNYSPSDGLDVNGFFKGVTASDYVSLPEYKGITIPAEVLEAKDEDVEEQIESILAEYEAYEKITDRAVENGDSVNIDYVGSIDGVEFSGGSTGGAGTDVTIGVTNYIDDFLEQLIGHMPGDRFDVNVTFPVDYGVDSLNGKDAVFDVTINHINGDPIAAELTDEIASEYGFENVEELKQDKND